MPAQSLNPPLLGTLAGVTVGLSPVGSVLFAPASAAARASAARLPFELLATLGAHPAPHDGFPSSQPLSLLAGLLEALGYWTPVRAS